MRLRADLTLFLVALIWGSAFAVQRLAALTGSVYMFNGIRFLLAALVIFILARRQPLPKMTESWPFILAGCVLFIAAALQQAGLRTTISANAGFFTSLYIVFIPVVLWLGWREKPAILALFSILVASIGAYLLSTGGRSISLRPGDGLELVGAVFWSLHVVILAKFGRSLNVLVFSAGQFLVAGLLNISAGFLLESFSLQSLAAMTGPILYTGLVSAGLGYTLQTWAQRYTPPVEAGLILSAEAIMAALSGFLLLHETLFPVQLAGCGLILLAIVLAQLKSGNIGAWFIT